METIKHLAVIIFSMCTLWRNYSMTTSATQMPSTPRSCTYNLTDLQGNFSSPHYPSRYPHHLNCTWYITVTPGSYIYLQFFKFSLEYGGKHCRYDYVEVSDANYPSSSIQIKRCGNQNPWCVWSTTNVLQVRFVTDFIVSAPGFMAHYTTYRNPDSGNCLSLNATQWSCAHNLTDLQGNFSSPNYPSSYPYHLNCTWYITVTPGSYIYLQFFKFYVEYGGKHCRYDYVEVSDANYPSSSIQIKRCGYQTPWCVWSTTNVLQVRFVTDLSASASGFMAHYTTYRNPGSGNCLSLNATQCKEVLIEHVQE
ncbi:dorsal-ventral patterning tolloid-like protein 1 [Montipora capricornis]|uniref:dorsal-ventral patterning tolloid-like protein 1 n=1 Tax=Montipora capricornis TaxID=246305 RepID=UPI0035F1844E